MPDGYRMPNQTELSLPIRDSDKHRFSMAAGDFNGDGLVDGAILAIDLKEKELALFVFLCTDKDQTYKWYKLESLKYESVKYTGVRTVKPQKISYYRNARDEVKFQIELVNDSFELFQFEGSSSLFYYETKSDDFKRVWTSK